MIWNKEKVENYLEKDKDSDSIYEITKKKKKTLRTYAQVKYYFWVIIRYIAEEVWLSNKFELMQLHEDIKEYFHLETTTWLDTIEFSAMCEEIRSRYLDNRNLYIPLPNETESLKDLESYLY